MTLRTFVATSSLLLCLAADAVARAQPSTAADENPSGTSDPQGDGRVRAKGLFAQGETAYQQKDFVRALDLYKRAFEAWPLPGFQFNIGQCYRQMGDFAQAIAAFNLYLEQSPNAPNRKTVVALLKTSKRELMRHPAAVDASAAAAPREAAPSTEPPPAPVDAPAGAPSASPPAAPTVAVAKEQSDEESDDDEDAAADAPSAASGAPVAGAAVQPAPVLHRSRAPMRKWFWTATASTGVFLATAIVTGSLALSRNHAFKDPSTSSSQRQDDESTGKALQTATNIGLVCSGVSAVAAVVLWTLRDRGAGDPGLSVAWTPGGVLFSQGGRF